MLLLALFLSITISISVVAVKTDECQGCVCPEMIMEVCIKECSSSGLCHVEAICNQCLDSCAQEHQCPWHCQKCQDQNQDQDQELIKSQEALDDTCNGSSNSISCHSCDICVKGYWGGECSPSNLHFCGACSICCPPGKQARVVCDENDPTDHGTNFAKCSCE